MAVSFFTQGYCRRTGLPPQESMCDRYGMKKWRICFMDESMAMVKDLANMSSKIMALVIES
jgi:hypothetical protein